MNAIPVRKVILTELLTGDARKAIERGLVEVVDMTDPSWGYDDIGWPLVYFTMTVRWKEDGQFEEWQVVAHPDLVYRIGWMHYLLTEEDEKLKKQYDSTFWGDPEKAARDLRPQEEKDREEVQKRWPYYEAMVKVLDKILDLYKIKKLYRENKERNLRWSFGKIQGFKKI